jgi:hypothetical protein
VQEGKYTDNWVVQHWIMPSLRDVLSREALTADNPIIHRFTISLQPGMEYYQLPPSVHTVLRVCIINTEGVVTADYRPFSDLHPTGPNWVLEGNVLAVRPFPTQAFDVTLWFVPTGDSAAHYSKNQTGVQVGSDNRTLMLASSPTLGFVDRRINAYVGQVLRVYRNGLVQERVIAEHDAAAGTVKVRVPFAPDWSSQPVSYEIAPILDEALMEAIAVMTAIRMGTASKISATHQEMLRRIYMQAIKSYRDRTSGMQARSGRAFERVTIDNPNIQNGVARFTDFVSW